MVAERGAGNLGEKEGGGGTSKEQEARLKHRAKNRACSCSVSCAAKSENPVPRSFFALKPNGNACYGG